MFRNALTFGISAQSKEKKDMEKPTKTGKKNPI